MSYKVKPYVYLPGAGAAIFDGPCVVATVYGTSYPVGSACEADYVLARKMAAAPEMLAALEGVITWLEISGVADSDPEPYLAMLAAIALARGAIIL